MRTVDKNIDVDVPCAAGLGGCKRECECAAECPWNIAIIECVGDGENSFNEIHRSRALANGFGRYGNCSANNNTSTSLRA